MHSDYNLQLQKNDLHFYFFPAYRVTTRVNLVHETINLSWPTIKSCKQQLTRYIATIPQTYTAHTKTVELLYFLLLV